MYGAHQDHQGQGGVRHIFAPGIYWDRRRPGGLPLQATMLLLADAVGATVCRRDGGGPSRDGQQASQRENVAPPRPGTRNTSLLDCCDLKGIG